MDEERVAAGGKSGGVERCGVRWDRGKGERVRERDTGREGERERE